VRAGCGMSRVRQEAVLAAPARDAALTAAVLALTAVVFALVADHGVLARIQHVDDAWLRLLGTSCALLAAVVVNRLQRRRGADRPRRSAHPPVSDPARPADRR